MFIDTLTPQTAHPIFGAIIHAYTRQQAIKDGALIDASAAAKEAGFTIPAALTRAAWADAVEWTPADSQRQTYQDETGRLWDVLRMAMLAACRNTGKSEVDFLFHRVKRGDHGRTGHIAKLTRHTLKIGFDDDGLPCITIMLPHED